MTDKTLINEFATDSDRVVALEKNAISFAETLVDSKGSFKSQTISLAGIDKRTTESLFQNPLENYARISSHMETMALNNGVIGRLFGYLQSHLTYNHTIYPTISEKNATALGGSLEDYLGAASFIDKYNIKFYAPYFVKQVLINGMAFFYKEQNAKGVTYIQFPIEWCRIYALENGVYRFSVDMSKIKEDVVPFLPKEVGSAYEKFKNGISSDDKGWTDSKHFHVSKKGVAFTLSQSALKDGGVAVSEFASLLVDSVQLKRAKDNINIKDDIDTIKIIHSKIPTDSEGKPNMSSKVAKIYDNALKRSLPSGIAAVTSPMDIENIPLNGSGSSKSYDTVDKAQEQLFTTTGVPSSLFGDDTASSNIVKLSILKDAAWMFTNVLPMLENYYNYEMASYKTKSGNTWSMSFLRQSYFNYEDYVKNTKDAVTMGGSRTKYLASIGMSPMEIYTTLVMEQQMLDIDSLMIPKQMSYTMSSDGSGEGAGRPQSKEQTDDTDRINGAE